MKASSGAGLPHRFVSTTPLAIVSAPASAAATPTGSSAASGRSTSSATPAIPPAPAATFTADSRSPRSGTASPATTRGWIAPIVAATPPGSRYAATKSSAKKTPMLSPPSTAARNHQIPRGKTRRSATSRSPIGSARIVAASSGRPSGSASVVTTYVDPHATGAIAVTATSARRLEPSDLRWSVSAPVLICLDVKIPQR